MFLKNCQLALFTLFAVIAQCQNNYTSRTRQDSVNALLVAIKLDNTIAQPNQIKTLRVLRQYHRFWFLDKLTTDEELATYATGNNACLRVYSLAALAYRNSRHYRGTKKTLSIDTGQVMISSGDFFSITTVSSFIKTNSFINLSSHRDTTYMTQSLDYKDYRDACFRILVGWQDDILKTRQDSINVLLTAIRKYNIFEPSWRGIAGTPSQQYYTFRFLEKLSTDAELLALTNDSIPCLRVYGYIALSARHYKQLGVIRNALLSDTSALSETRGCVTSATTVSALIKMGNIESAFLDDEKDGYWRQLNIDLPYQAVYFKELISLSH